MKPENQTYIGRFNRLQVLRAVDFGVYLDGGDLGDILLPRRYVPAHCAVGDNVHVFVYVDSEDRLVATTDTPRVQVGECAFLKVVAVNAVGAFLDWGLPKDLLVPFGLDASDPQFWDKGLAMISGFIDELEAMES